MTLVAWATRVDNRRLPAVRGGSVALTRVMVLSLVSLLFLVSVRCSDAAANELDLEALPVVDPFRCAICHVDTEPAPGGAALNLFGVDFLAAGRQWTAELAAQDSDEDDCTNGVELGDIDADGQADGNVNELQSNPGDSTDCGVNTVDPTTWTELKGLFNRK